MEHRYARNLPALSMEECASLLTKRVLIVGCGGLGGFLIDQMARIGIGGLRVVDGDRFESTNLNRQLLSNTQNLGQSKAMAAAEHIAKVNPQVEIEFHTCYLTAENALELVMGCDAVLDGLDNIESRRILSQACSKAKIPLIFGGICGWVAQAGISMPSDGLIDILYPAGTVLTDKSVLSFTPALCASMQTSLCIKLLTGRAVDTGTIYYFDLLNQEFETVPLV